MAMTQASNPRAKIPKQLMYLSFVGHVIVFLIISYLTYTGELPGLSELLSG